jgi:basic membrane protein A
VSRKRAAAAVALLGILALLVSACGGGGSSTGAAGTSGGTTGGKSIKVGLVTDIGGLNDRSFNHLAFVGLKQAESQFGVQGRVLTSTQNSDYVPNLSSLAQQGYDLVIGVGFLMADAMATVAAKYPNTDFAIIDYSAAALKGKPKNVEGLLFAEQQAGYLAGYLAGLAEKQNIVRTRPGPNIISSVGGQKIPPVDHYIAGYQYGANKAAPGIKTLNGYSQDFVAQDKCKNIALNQIQAGSDVVFQVAGGCGLGALDAAKTKGVWGIGVDADQSYLGPYILTSAVKKVNVAVVHVITQVQNGTFKGGTDYVSTVANNGVGIGKISSQVPADIVAKVEAQEKLLAAGKLTDIPTTVK